MPPNPESPNPACTPQPGEAFNPRWESCKFYPSDAINRRKELSPAAKLLYARLLKFVNKQGVCWSTQGVLARELARSERQTRRDLEALAGAGFIRWKVRGCGRARSTRTFYEFLWHGSFTDLYDRTLTSVRNEVTTGQTEPYDRTSVAPKAVTTGHVCPPKSQEQEVTREASEQPPAPSPSENDGDGNEVDRATAISMMLRNYDYPPFVPLEEPMQFCEQINAASNGAPLDDIHAEFLELWKAKRRPRSWGLFLDVIAKKFGGKSADRSVEGVPGAARAAAARMQPHYTQASRDRGQAAFGGR